MKERHIYNAAIYVRLSKEDGDVSDASRAESNSISNQRELIKDFLKDKTDIRVVSERVDDGFSGVDFERPAFRLMLEDIRQGKVDCVVVKDLSRFGRNYIESGRYIEKIFPMLGVRFIAVNDGYDSLAGKSQTDEIVIPFKNLINDATAGIFPSRSGAIWILSGEKGSLSALLPCSGIRRTKGTITVLWWTSMRRRWSGIFLHGSGRA